MLVFKEGPSGENNSASQCKKVIVITARIHPGESPAQFVCQGIIDFLASDDQRAQVLRHHLEFKVIPMMNPDGVYIGNYRCSYSGKDLNRCWEDPQNWESPEIFAAKKFLVELAENENDNLDFYIDIHAHSTASCGFMYGNASSNTTNCNLNTKDNGDLFPRILDRISQYFSYENTKYDNDPNKKGTGRRTLGDLLGPKVHCYTLEVSFFTATTSDDGSRVLCTEDIYREIGRDVAISLIDYYGLSV